MMAKWILEEEEYIDDFQHHKCSSCDALSLFSYTYNEDYDEGMDGEWVSLGYIASGISENITLYCPNCGSKMDCTEALHRIYGCKKCKWFDESNGWFGIENFLTNLPDNAITDVKFDVAYDDEHSDEHFTLYVFYEDVKLNLISYSGYDNGYYGTGFSVVAEFV